MAPLPYAGDLPENITCIDTGYGRPGLAACYLIEAGNQAAFVDTGTYYTIPFLLEFLQHKGIALENVAYIMPTHVHLDHAGGAGKLMQHCPNATLVAHPRGARHLIDPSRLAAGAIAVYGKESFHRNFGELIPIPEERVIIANDEFVLDFNGRQLLFLDTPGHARHHYSIFDKQSNGFFTGDTFGLSYRELDSDNGVFIFPTTTPVQFDPDAWHLSLERYLGFSPERMFLTHFGMIKNVTKLASQLQQGIDRLAKIARDAEHGNNRHAVIKEAVTKFLVTELHAFNPNADVSQCLQLFNMDLELNTQGLEVWLDRNPRNES